MQSTIHHGSIRKVYDKIFVECTFSPCLSPYKIWSRLCGCGRAGCISSLQAAVTLPSLSNPAISLRIRTRSCRSVPRSSSTYAKPPPACYACILVSACTPTIRWRMSARQFLMAHARIRQIDATVLRTLKHTSRSKGLRSVLDN